MAFLKVKLKVSIAKERVFFEVIVDDAASNLQSLTVGNGCYKSNATRTHCATNHTSKPKESDI